jgi:hypothetical protein
MTTTALHDALSLIVRVAADTRRVWAAIPRLIGPASRGLAMRSAAGVCQAARLTTTLFVLPWGFVVCWSLGAGATHAASSSPSRPTEVWPVEVGSWASVGIGPTRDGGTHRFSHRRRRGQR